MRAKHKATAFRFDFKRDSVTVCAIGQSARGTRFQTGKRVLQRPIADAKVNETELLDAIESLR